MIDELHNERALRNYAYLNYFMNNIKSVNQNDDKYVNKTARLSNMQQCNNSLTQSSINNAFRS